MQKQTPYELDRISLKMASGFIGIFVTVITSTWFLANSISAYKQSVRDDINYVINLSRYDSTQLREIREVQERHTAELERLNKHETKPKTKYEKFF